MSTNSLEIFQQLFRKPQEAIKSILFLATPYLAEQDQAIATFLGLEHTKLVWLIWVFQDEYNKQFPNQGQLWQYAIENIARSITLNTEKTGTLDYGL